MICNHNGRSLINRKQFCPNSAVLYILTFGQWGVLNSFPEFPIPIFRPNLATHNIQLNTLTKRASALNNAVVTNCTRLPDFGLCQNGCAGFSALGPLQQVAPGGDASTAALCANSFEGNSYPQLHYLFPIIFLAQGWGSGHPSPLACPCLAQFLDGKEAW